jgi:SAM-dependent methyltransferase
MSDDPWWRGIDELVLAAVPQGARILDVGCGDGGLVDRLVGAGLDAYGVDPRAPERPRLVRIKVEDWKPTERFDVACAVMALHHSRLEPVVAALKRCLQPNGKLFVSEFAWEAYDHRAAAWLAQHDRAGADNATATWQAEHADLHTSATIHAALADAFTLLNESSGPHLARMLGRPDLEDEEHALIVAEALPPLGRLYIARA